MPKNSVGESFTITLISGTEKSLDRRGRGVSRFSVEIFLSHSAEKFPYGKSFTVALISGIEKVWMGEGEYQDFPSKNFCLTVPKISVWEILYCCINFGYRKSLDGRGGVSRFSVENFLSYSAENLPRESFTVALFSGTEKVWIRGGGGLSRFSVEKFLSHSAEKSAWESFTVALISGIEKVWMGGGEYQDFPSKIFCLTVPKIFVGDSFSVALISGTEKVWRRGGGGMKILRRNFFVSQCRKFP